MSSNSSEPTILAMSGDFQNAMKSFNAFGYKSDLFSNYNGNDESIALYGHSTAGQLSIQGMGHKEIAQSLCNKYTDKQSLKKLYLIACSPSEQIKLNDTSEKYSCFAECLANELHELGFNTTIYAPEKLEIGQTSTFTTNTMGSLVIIHKIFDSFGKQVNEKGACLLAQTLTNSGIFVAYHPSAAFLIQQSLDNFYQDFWKSLYDFLAMLGIVTKTSLPGLDKFDSAYNVLQERKAELESIHKKCKESEHVPEEFATYIQGDIHYLASEEHKASFDELFKSYNDKAKKIEKLKEELMADVNKYLNVNKKDPAKRKMVEEVSDFLNGKKYFTDINNQNTVSNQSIINQVWSVTKSWVSSSNSNDIYKSK